LTMWRRRSFFVVCVAAKAAGHEKRWPAPLP
jgi:hypothetical protein